MTHPLKLNGSWRASAPFIVLSSQPLPTTPMPCWFARPILVAAFALSLLAPAAAWADRYSYPPHSGPRDGGLPASVRRVQRETGGEVLRAQPIERDGREVYRVKVLTPQGRIRVVEDSPQYEPGPPYRQGPQNYPRPAQQQDDPRQGPQQYPRQVPQNYPRPGLPMYQRPPPPPRYPPQHNHLPQ